MAKKITTDEAEEVITEEVADRLTVDFGRQDLNDMRDAINELFKR